MKKAIRILASALIAISIMGINGCKKGEDGAPGKNGSSNVTARTFSVPSWSSNSSRYYAQLSVPELTSSNLNSASVQVYWGTGNDVWIALPYTYVSSTNYFMGYATAVNIAEVRWDYNGVGIGSDPNSMLNSSNALQIKVVIIPPSAKVANPNVDYSNYKEVKTTFNLAE